MKFWEIGESDMPAAGGIIAQTLHPDVRGVLVVAHRPQVRMDDRPVGLYKVLSHNNEDLLAIPNRLGRYGSHHSPSYLVAGHGTAARVWLNWDLRWDGRLRHDQSHAIQSALRLARQLFDAGLYYPAQTAALGEIFRIAGDDVAMIEPASGSDWSQVIASIPPIGSVILERSSTHLAAEIAQAQILSWNMRYDQQGIEVFWMSPDSIRPHSCRLSPGPMRPIAQGALGIMRQVGMLLEQRPLAPGPGGPQINPSSPLYPYQQLPYDLSYVPDSTSAGYTGTGKQMTRRFPVRAYEKRIHAGHRKGTACLDAAGNWDPDLHPRIVVPRHKRGPVAIS